MTDSNALGWVFPQPGEDTPPEFSEVNFGPIHYKDSIVIQFTPATYTGEIRLYCDYQNGMQGNVWTLTNTGSPLTYNFNQKTPNPDDPTDYHACHFFFAANTVSTSVGNTQAFQYMNNATSNAVTWSASGSSISSPGKSTSISASTSTKASSSPTSTSNTSATSIAAATTVSSSGSASHTSSSSQSTSITSSITSSTSSATIPGQGAATASSNSPIFEAQSQSSGLSGGAIAGIVIGVLALIALIAGLGFFFGRRARRSSSEPTPMPPGQETKIEPMYQPQQNGYPHQGYYDPSMQNAPAWANKQQPNQVRMGELYGQPVSELDAPAVHEMGGGYRNELP